MRNYPFPIFYNIEDGLLCASVVWRTAKSSRYGNSIPPAHSDRLPEIPLTFSYHPTIDFIT